MSKELLLDGLLINMDGFGCNGLMCVLIKHEAKRKRFLRGLECFVQIH